MAYIEVVDTYKRYKIGENIVVANNGINFSISIEKFSPLFATTIFSPILYQIGSASCRERV